MRSVESFPHKYQLRPRIFNRKIRIALVITMYNEDEKLFLKSIAAVQRNIAFLCNTKKCKSSWGEMGWKNFLVVIVADGRKKVHPKVLDMLEILGVFVPKLARTTIDQRAVSAHIFEFTTQVCISEGYEILNHADGIVPMQILYLMKEDNAKKINSHKWFFSAICETVDPKVTILLDVGTKPSERSFYHLNKAFERNPLVGGACGEIKADIGDCGYKLLNPLVAAQNFEYKMSNILDKPLESSFGYISVLPGAFSAYRYSAIRGRPLEQYFKGEAPGSDIFTSNLYLAEDRILCFELVTDKKRPWILKYVKSARAETDVPEALDELVSQRRRWLNGSFFCSIYAVTHFNQMYHSPQSRVQKVLFTIQFIYNATQLLFTWFAIGNFYLSFYFLFDIRKDGLPNSQPGIDPFFPAGDIVFQILRGLYLFGLVCILITALGNRPRGTRWLYMTLSIFFVFLMVMMLFMAGWSIRLAVLKFINGIPNFQGDALAYLRQTPEFRDLVIAGSTTYGFYLLASLIHLDPWHLFTSLVQYLLLMPTYINIFMIYSFTNLHDVSWGTKGSTELTDTKPVAKIVDLNGEVTFEYVFTDPDDVNMAWRNTFSKLQEYRSETKDAVQKRDEKTRQEVILIDKDATKIFRTKVVLFWIVCNILLVLIFTNDGSLKAFFPNRNGNINPYLTFLFW